MDIIFLQQYTVEHKQPKQVGGRISKRQLETLPNYTCHAFVPASPQNPDTLFAGRQNGQLVSWRYMPGKEGNHEDQVVLGSHSGPITCMLHHPVYSRFLFTGSSDATIRVWDPFGIGVEGNKCIQTIRAPYGHDATVTALAAHCDTLLSCSCDKTLKVWRPDEGRSELKYPWFVVKQLFLFDYWTTCVWSFPTKIAEDTLGEVYVGDAGGGLTMLRSIVAHQVASDQIHVERLELVKHHRSFRALGVTQILPLPTLNVVLTLSYDDTVRLSDITNLETLVSLTNRERPGQRFVDMVWSPAEEELVLADATGALTVWNSRADKLVCETHAGQGVSRLTMVEHRGQHTVLASTMAAVKCFAITRSLPYKQHLGHTQRVLGLHVFHGGDDSHSVGAGEDLCVVSASVDNTICFWSVLDSLQCTKTLTEKGRNSEISAFLYIPQERIVVTGHENGSLRVWNPQTDKSWRVGVGGVTGAGHTNTVSSLAYAGSRYSMAGVLEDRPHVVSASFDGHLAIWEVRVDSHVSPRVELRWQVSREEQLCVVYDPIHHTYCAGGNDGIVSVWSLRDPRKERLVSKLHGPDPGMYGDYPSHETGAVTTLALDGNYLFSGGEDERIIMWSLVAPDFERLRVFQDHGEVNAILVMPDTGDLLTCSRAGTVLRWSQTGRVAARFESPHKEELRCLSYCRLNDEVYVGSEEGGILRISLTPLPGGEQQGEYEVQEDIHMPDASVLPEPGSVSPGARSIPEEIRPDPPAA
eukprot:TRINITY_DN16422_c0_g1_i1.p1 TRINITY_DN16422_c0_g1~~TRINITY_DN16422_c0_g1_i1.p1  ORF type:complete len:753 (+),score=286.51 TRINITY_DN16422_c0_g1_i1:67-2325(+)